MIVRFAALSLSLMLIAGTAAAQDNKPPARIGNIYDGTAHEPSPGAVRAGESAAGVLPPASVAKGENSAIQQLDKQVQRNSTPSNAAPAESLACRTSPAACK